MNIVKSNERYEAWLHDQLRERFTQDKRVRLVKEDLAAKHKKMCRGKRFLRATYWRWAETIFEICPELKDAPSVVAVGDIHIENFGTWRDDEGRLIWGVNDFDEAAEMPYALDIVRLATSAAITGGQHLTARSICDLILSGYRAGLANPKALVLEEAADWLYENVRAGAKDFKAFWEDLMVPDTTTPNHRSGKAGRPPPSFVAALDRERPKGTTHPIYQPRTAGGGSLGRPRWVLIGEWQGGTVVREAKALVASAWTYVHGEEPNWLWCNRIAKGRYRSPDPWYRERHSILTRRLSPNNRKLEILDDPSSLAILPALLNLMGQDLAAVHLGIADRRKEIDDHLAAHDTKFCEKAVTNAVESVREDHREWSKSEDVCRQKTAANSRVRKVPALARRPA